MAKRKNRAFGVRVVFNDGTVYEDILESASLGNLLAVWRGTFDHIGNSNINVFSMGGEDNEYKYEELTTHAGDVVCIPIKKISYIKYQWNQGIILDNLDDNIYDWDKELK